MIYVMITSLIGGLQMFDVPQILTNGKGSPMRSSMTLIMYLNKHLFSRNYGMAGALSVILLIITGILSLIVYKATVERNKGGRSHLRHDILGICRSLYIDRREKYMLNFTKLIS